jgi:hydrogenase expression/formation protein HypC
MCIGLPMQITALQPGHAWVEGRGERRLVNTALVGPCAVGDWLLIFLDGAREWLTPERAQEINATLDLLGSAMQGSLDHRAMPAIDPGFALPSAMSAAEVAALAGHGTPTTTPPPIPEETP